MGKKDDGMGNKTGYKKRKAEGKQRARKKDRTKKTRQAGQPAFSYKNNACFMRGTRHEASSPAGWLRITSFIQIGRLNSVPFAP